MRQAVEARIVTHLAVAAALEGRDRAFAAEDILPRLEACWAAEEGEFVRELYRTLLGRAVDPVGLAHCLSLLRNGQSRFAVAHALAASREGQRAGVDVAALVRLELALSTTLPHCLLRLWPLPTAEFVRGLHAAFHLGVPGEPRVRADAGRLEAGLGRAAYLEEVLARPELDGERPGYRWLGELDRLTPQGMWRELHRLWTLPAPDFLAGVFRLLLARNADAGGLAYFTPLAATGPGRVEVVRTVLASEEFRATGLPSDWAVRLDELLSDCAPVAPGPASAAETAPASRGAPAALPARAWAFARRLLSSGRRPESHAPGAREQEGRPCAS